MNKTLFLYGSIICSLAWLPLVAPINRNLEYEYFFCLNILFNVLAFLVAQIPKISKVILLEYKKLMVFGFIVTLSPLGLLLHDQGCPCSPLESLLWLLLLWLPGWFVTWATFFVFHSIRQLPLNLLRRLGLQLLFGILFLILPLIIMWIFPQKRLTGIYWGFIHGPIYDHWIPIDGGIILSRTIHALIGLFTVLVLRPAVTMITRFIWLPGLIALIIINLVPFPFSSHGHGKKALRLVLPHVYKGEGYEVHTSLAESEDNRPKIERLIRQVEFHLDDLKEFNSLDHPVLIYVYDNRDQKKLVFGGGSTDVTDVVTPSIHITWQHWPHRSLRHELVHAITSGDAFWGLGFHPNIAFTEGLATALAPSGGTFSLDESVHTLSQQNKLPPMKSLLSPMFWLESGPRAYRTAGSFLQFLLKHYSQEKVVSLYNGSSWDELFPLSLEETIQNWLQDINKMPELANNHYGEALFRYPGIFHDICPHSKAALAQGKNIFPSWRQPSSWTHEDYLHWLEQLSPQSLRYQYRARFLEIKAAFKKDDDKTIERLLKSFPSKSEINYLEDFHFQLLAADLNFLLYEDRQVFQKNLQQLKGLAKNNFLGFSNLRQLDLRLYASEHLDNPKLLGLVSYLAQLKPFKELTAFDDWLYLYFKLRRQISFSESELKTLLKSKVPHTLSNNINFEWYKYLGIRMMHKGHFSLAAQSFKEALLFDHEGARSLMELFLREAEWNLQKEKS